MRTVVNRYKSSRAIGFWELFNEAAASDPNIKTVYRETSDLIKSLDPNHLVGSGGHAAWAAPSTAAYTDQHNVPNLDLISMHEYDDRNFYWADVAQTAARTLNKPFYVGEDGFCCGSGPDQPWAQNVPILRAEFDTYLLNYPECAGMMYWDFKLGYPVPGMNTYRVGGSCSIGGACDIMYITRTGALWAGPIESAKFRFRLPIWMNSLRYPKWSKPKSIQMVYLGDDAYTEVLFEQTQWKPKADLWVAFEQDYFIPEWTTPGTPTKGVPPCPLVGYIYDDAQQAVNEGDSAVAELAKVWSRESPEALKTCANNVFARYGRKFDSNRNNRFFYGSKGWLPGKPPYKLYAPNPAFSNRVLTPFDWAVLRVLRTARDLSLASRHLPPDPEPAIERPQVK